VLSNILVGGTVKVFEDDDRVLEPRGLFDGAM
jgi:hypothetical protein